MLGWSLLCIASVVFVIVYAVVLRIQPMAHLAVMTVGAVCWYVATVAWLGGWAVPRLVPWLAGFLVFTILGERLELARVAVLTRSSIRHFAAGAGLFGGGCVLTALSGTRRASGCGWPAPGSSRSRSGGRSTTSPGAPSRSRVSLATWPSACSPATSGSSSAG